MNLKYLFQFSHDSISKTPNKESIGDQQEKSHQKREEDDGKMVNRPDAR